MTYSSRGCSAIIRWLDSCGRSLLGSQASSTDGLRPLIPLRARTCLSCQGPNSCQTILRGLLVGPIWHSNGQSPQSYGGVSSSFLTWGGGRAAPPPTGFFSNTPPCLPTLAP